MTHQSPYLLTEGDLDHLRQWFSNYVESFSSQNRLTRLTRFADPSAVRQAFKLKEEHSLRVGGDIVDIGRELGLSQNNLRLAEAMGLLHDIGRFEQFARYQTFVDLKSENHAELGIAVLGEQKALAALAADTQELIVKAISNHNRFRVPAEESHACIYFSNLLRDADKLDIFNVVSTHYANGGKNAAIELDLPDTPAISDDVIASLNRGKLIEVHQLRSLNDFKLLQMGWVYDINFQPTRRKILERDYLTKIRGALPASEKIDQVYSRIDAHLRKEA